MLKPTLILRFSAVISDGLQVKFLLDIVINDWSTISEMLAISSGVAILFLSIALYIWLRAALLVLAGDRSTDPALAWSSSVHLHNLLLYYVDILLAGPHPLNQSMVLLFEILTLLVQLIILKGYLHELLLSKSLPLLGLKAVLLVLLNPLLQFLSPRLE